MNKNKKRNFLDDNLDNALNTPDPYDILKLDNQLCFSLYVCSKEIIRKYKSILSPYDLTYTGYITMLALWEKDEVTVKELGKMLYLDSGTLTPLLKKLEKIGYLERTRDQKDERQVYVKVTKKGWDLQTKALTIPRDLVCSAGLDTSNGHALLSTLHQLMKQLGDNETT